MNLDSVSEAPVTRNLPPRSDFDLGKVQVGTPDETWAFLRAPRFWAMIIGAVSWYLQQKGIFGQEEMELILAITAGFIGIRTLDRTVEKLAP